MAFGSVPQAGPESLRRKRKTEKKPCFFRKRKYFPNRLAEGPENLASFAEISWHQPRFLESQLAFPSLASRGLAVAGVCSALMLRLPFKFCISSAPVRVPLNTYFRVSRLLPCHSPVWNPFTELITWPVTCHCVCNKNIYPSRVQGSRVKPGRVASSWTHLLLLGAKDLVAVFYLGWYFSQRQGTFLWPSSHLCFLSDFLQFFYWCSFACESGNC